MICYCVHLVFFYLYMQCNARELIDCYCCSCLFVCKTHRFLLLSNMYRFFVKFTS